MSIILDDVRINISGIRYYKPKGLRISTKFEIPAGKIVEIDDTILKVGRVDSAEFSQVNFFVKGKWQGYYDASTIVDIPEAKSYQLIFPSFHINGKFIILPEITLSEKTKPEFFMPINC